MVEPRTAAPVGRSEAPRVRAALEYAVRGDLRYLSHHDELRMLGRALVRARWPLRYSQGFNPMPRLSIPLPRSVGMESECQWAVVELGEARPEQLLAARLAAVLPGACELKQVIAPAPPGTPHPRAVEYRVAIDPPERRSVATRVRRVMALEQLVVQRAGAPGKPARPVDIRPYLDVLALDGTELRMRLRYAQQQSARPAEILMELGLAADAYNQRVRRSAVIWDMELAGAGVAPAAPEGTKLGTRRETPQQ